jgi:hypothetical protein
MRQCWRPPINFVAQIRESIKIGSIRRDRGRLRRPLVGKVLELRTLLFIVGWCLLFMLCWPLAVLAVILWPLLWLLSIPFRLVSITFEAVFALIKAILFLPARLFGHRDGSARRPTWR